MLHERLLRFPSDRSLGILAILDPGDRTRPWDPAFVPRIPAQGDIAVPAGKEVRLHLRFADPRYVDLSPLRELGPTELEFLSLDCCNATDTDLRHITHLTGLVQFHVLDIRMTDDGLIHIGKLVSLESLSLNHVRVTDAGLAHLLPLTNLRRLDLDSTPVTLGGVRWLNDVLPKCEVIR